MDTTIIVALIAGACTLLSAFISAFVASAVLKTRLEALEKKVDTHNGYAEKFSSASQDIAVLKTDVGWIKTRMEAMK